MDLDQFVKELILHYLEDIPMHDLELVAAELKRRIQSSEEGRKVAIEIQKRYET